MSGLAGATKKCSAAVRISSYEDILELLKRRDQFDTTRAVSPLRPAEDAVRLNTDGLTIDQVLARLDNLVGLS